MATSFLLALAENSKLGENIIKINMNQYCSVSLPPAPSPILFHNHKTKKIETHRTMASANDVSIKLSHEIDERGEYNAFTLLSVDILVRGQNAGSVTAVVVNRQMIPERMFLSAMDGHSGELQWLAVSIFEPRFGRTKLTSLRDGDDDYVHQFMYVEEMHVNDEYKQDGNSDVGANALQQLLRHPYVKGKVSSCIYILDPCEGMTREEKERVDRQEDEQMRSWREDPPPETEDSLRAKEEKLQRMDDCARLDANQFIRNGFYQEAAVAGLGGNSPRILVACSTSMNRPLKSHTEAASVQFHVAPPDTRPPVGKDAEILELTKKCCQDCSDDVGSLPGRPVMNGAINPGRASSYQAKVSRLIQEGGSLKRSNALHAAAALNDSSIVRTILQMDPTTLESWDVNNVTPLIMAASAAAGRRNKCGFAADQPVIDALLAAGANRGATDSKGLTAYGTFLSSHKDYTQMMQALTGNPVQSSNSSSIPGYAGLEARLMPPGGPTRADKTGGDSAEPGFINYKEEDSDYESCGDY